MTEYVRGTTRLHKPPEEQGLNLSFMGLDKASMRTWMHLQVILRSRRSHTMRRP
jgi:hypothetical protein